MMRLRGTHQDAMLTSEEITLIRHTLTACSQVLTWAAEHASQQVREMIAEAAHAAHGNRSPAAASRATLVSRSSAPEPRSAARQIGPYDHACPASRSTSYWSFAVSTRVLN